MKYRKKPISVCVEFAVSNGLIQTLEGPVQYLVGDALLNGTAGERWPIVRARFEKTYSPADATLSMGQPGKYIKNPICVDAVQTNGANQIPLPEAQGILHVKPGDWILTSGDGSRWVVDNDIFLKTYEPVEE